MLSGQDLIKSAEKLHTKLLTIGTKSTNAEDSSTKAETFLAIKENYKDVCCKQRVSRLESRMTGHYNIQSHTVTVKRFTGTSHRLFGKADKEGTHLRLYEALYLMEIDDLLVYYEDVIVSVEQAYVLFLGAETSEMTFEQYSAYKTLLQAGFVVLRHKKVHLGDEVEAKQEGSSPKQETPVPSLSKSDQIWDYLRSKVHFLNWDQIKCTDPDLDENIPVSFREICDDIQNDRKSESPQVKKRKLELKTFPERKKTQEETHFLNLNERHGFEQFFSELDQIRTVSDVDLQPSNESQLFDFDIYYADDAKKRKLSQNNPCSPNFYGKVVKFEDQIDYSLIHCLKRQVGPTPVMLIVVFENLTISSFIC